MKDYLDLFHEEEERLAKIEERLPKCDCCGETINEDYAYEINGERICEDCLFDNYRVSL